MTFYQVHAEMKSTGLIFGYGWFESLATAVGHAYNEADSMVDDDVRNYHYNANDFFFTPVYELEGGENFGFDVKRKTDNGENVVYTFYIIKFCR